MAWPLKILDCCLLSEGASCVFLASEDVARKYTDEPVWITGVGLASDMMRPGDRPDNPGFAGLFPDEYDAYPAHAIKPREPYPDIANFGACRMAARQCYEMAGITDPYHQIDLFEIHDAYDSSELGSTAKATLQANAAWLGANSGYNIMIEGHCDERGTIEYNLALGERRATAVRDYLASLGVSPSRMRIVSFGEERPADPGHTEAAWAKNRRGIFVIES